MARALALFAALPALIAFAAPHAARAQEEARIEVVVSILPLADFVRQVGGAHVRVTILVPPGSNPHAFALRPSQVARLNRARLLVLNGLGLEFWADSVVASLDQRRIRVLRLGERLALPPMLPGEPPPEPGHGETPGEASEEDHGAADPHVWMDPVLAMEMVRRIRDALGAADPAHGAEYARRAEAYLAELARLDADYRRELDALAQRTFVAFHAGFAYLAERYGLTEVAILQGPGDAEPSPARVAEVIRTARRLGARAIFAEPQYPQRAARLIAEEAGIGLAVLDGLGRKEDATYLGLMRENLKQLVSALR